MVIAQNTGTIRDYYMESVRSFILEIPRKGFALNKLGHFRSQLGLFLCLSKKKEIIALNNERGVEFFVCIRRNRHGEVLCVYEDR